MTGDLRPETTTHEEPTLDSGELEPPAVVPDLAETDVPKELQAIRECLGGAVANRVVRYERGHAVDL